MTFEILKLRTYLVGTKGHGSNSSEAHGQPCWLLDGAKLRTRHLCFSLNCCSHFGRFLSNDSNILDTFQSVFSQISLARISLNYQNIFLQDLLTVIMTTISVHFNVPLQRQKYLFFGKFHLMLRQSTSPCRAPNHLKLLLF